jgi:hypothetical protein
MDNQLMSVVTQRISACLLVGFLAFAGCSGPPDETVAAGGVVHLDGKPVEGVSVSLLPQLGVRGRGGYGVTDAEGKFTFSSGPDAIGVMPGTYRVLFQKMRQKDGSPIPPDLMAADIEIINQLPAVYSSPENTPISAVIPSPDGDFLFELKSR